MLKKLFGVFKFAPKNEISEYLIRHKINGVKNLSVFEKSLRHKSLNRKESVSQSNERLEFLGDAVLDLVISEFLFNKFPDVPEGKLTKYRSYLVNRNHLNNVAKASGLNKLIKFNLKPNEVSDDLFGNAFEAFIAAVYLEAGYKKTTIFIENTVLKNLNSIEKIERLNHDYKSRVLEWAQNIKKDVHYSIDEINGIFKCKITLENQTIAEDFGHSKKEAHQNASKKAYYILVNNS